MSRKIFRLAAVIGLSVVFLGLVLAFARARFFYRDLTLENMVTRGGIGLSNPVQVAPDRWFVPVRFDVSGRRKITHEPQHIDSMASIDNVRIEVEARRICLSVGISTFPLERRQREFFGTFLSGNLSGEYEVVYCTKGTRVPLGRIVFVPVFPALGSQTPPRGAVKAGAAEGDTP